MPYVNNQGVNIYYEVEGQGQPLMMIHGGTSDMSLWTGFGYVERLKEQYMVILMDLRGHGKSDKLYDPAQYHYQLMMSDVIAVLDELNIEKAHYWGWSMGGYIEFALAKHHPQRIHSLIIGGCVPNYEEDPENPDPPDALLEVLQRGVNGGVEAIVEGMRVWAGGSITPQSEARLRRMDPRAHLACYEAFQASPNLGDVLPTMTMPCFVYIGEFDGAEYAVEYVQHMPNASLLIVPGRKHADTSQAVDLFMPQALEFLATVK